MKGLLQILLLTGVVLYSQCDQYILIQEVKTWHEADVFCRVDKYLLGTVHNETDWKDFREEMSASNFNFNVWMGLYVDVNSWRWSFQNENITWSKWNLREPNNFGGHEECGAFQKSSSGGSWNDAPCFIPMPCVCFDGEKRH
nr:C-type lectin-like [Misgurnus anguillicaudatus]